MALIDFYIRNQKLSKTAPTLVADSINYVNCSFTFKTDDWNGFDKWVVFSKGEQNYRVDLIDDAIPKEAGLNLGEGLWSVSVFGENPEGTERITTNSVTVEVAKSTVQNGEPLPPISLTEAEQISAKAQLALNAANEVLAKAESGEFNGVPGKDGENATPEQIAEAVEDYFEENPTGNGGLSATATTLLATILRNAVYSSNQSANITALESALGGGDNGGGDSGNDEAVTYAIVNTLSNVTTNNSLMSVEANTSYTATLTAADGYEINSVSVLMGGVDVTNTVYADGVVSIPAVTGMVIITATAVVSDSGDDGGDTPSNLLYNWDLTKSLTDTVKGEVLTLSDSGATQDANGLTISAGNGYAMAQILDENMTVELDIVSFVRTGTGHARLLSYHGTTGTNDKGFIYRSTGKWAWYGKVWTDTSETDPTALDGKTISVSFGTNTDTSSNGTCPIIVKVNGEELVTQESAVVCYDKLDRLAIGSPNGLSAYTLVVSGLRVYEGV